MPSRFTDSKLDALIAATEALYARCLALERSHASEDGAPAASPSARNLLHYLALRQQDLRDLQADLAEYGLSSLGRSEAHTLATLDAVLAALLRMRGRTRAPRRTPPPVTFHSGPEILRVNAAHLLGPAPPERAVRIMVTMPSEAAASYALVRDLVAAGMDVMRINCAHDDSSAWRKMAANLERAARELGRDCRVLMDLAGPKLRTGPLEGGAHVVRWRPRRTLLRHVAEPARLCVVETGVRLGAVAAEAAAVLPVNGIGLGRGVETGDRLRVRDSLGRWRTLSVLGCGERFVWAAAERSGCVLEEAPVELVRRGKPIAHGQVRGVPFVSDPLVLRTGDRLEVTAGPAPGCAEQRGEHGELLSPARIPCTLPEVLSRIQPGVRILFDDGKIGGVVREAHPGRLLVEIVHAAPGGSKLGEDKGINLPDSDLGLPALTAKDLEDLDTAVAIAGVVGLSFVHQPEDIVRLRSELAARNAAQLGVLLKVENRTAFESLPRLLWTGMAGPLGVMVARGDLAVEMGFERLAEVQEEILWLCEAAHIPVVWATQVLENLAKKGAPSRAEVTDAAMGVRAECVMLNKGPYIVEAVRFLDNVLHRMQDHQSKKRSMLRKLGVSSLGDTAGELEAVL